MRIITLTQPKRLVFGTGCVDQFRVDYLQTGLKRLFILTAPRLLSFIDMLIKDFQKANIKVFIDDSIDAEPTLHTLQKVLQYARSNHIDSVAGIGGGSVLDVAKLVAALVNSDQQIHQVFGIDRLKPRQTYLACLPTTSGTGSEVSPNAILLDEAEEQKKAVISGFLVADAAYVDPALTWTVPPQVTAMTGMDALSHCIEAFANKFAHPMVDLYALEGIRRIASSLKRAFDDGQDMQARTDLALGSLYGGMCLGPVNTAATHALAYPLGGRFHVAHGFAIAVLLPFVLEFNIESAPERYAEIALALGAQQKGSISETARSGLEKVRELCRSCGMPQKLAELNISRKDISYMAASAMSVSRLLQNNLCEMTENDIIMIYNKAFE
jgi:alcohol dehydrogenase